MPKATIIWFGGDKSPFRTFTVKKRLVVFAVVAFCAMCVTSAVLAIVAAGQHSELLKLRTELKTTETQRQAVAEKNAELDSELERVKVLESRVRQFLGLESDDGAPQRSNQGGDGPSGALEDFDKGSATTLAMAATPETPLERTVEQGLSEIVTYLDERFSETDKLPTILPVKSAGAWISCYYGWRTNPMSGKGKEHHNGLDIAGQWNSPIIAPSAGKVVRSARDTYLGNYVKLDHGDGLFTTYGHLNSRSVKVGQRVKRGDVIGRMGKSGRTTGTHLHYAVVKNKRYVNPLQYIWDSPSNQLAGN